MMVTTMAAPRIFDRKLLMARRKRAIRLGEETFLLDRVAEELVERLSAIKRQFTFGLDLGTPGDALQSRLQHGGQVERIVASVPAAEFRTGTLENIVGDDEALSFRDETFDLIVSALSLQWVNDLPGTLLQIRRALKPDGLAMAALIGGETLKELRECLTIAELELDGGASPRISPFVEVRSLGSLLQRAQFALPVVDVDRHVVRYSSLQTLFVDLRRMGATNVLVERSRRPISRRTIARTAEIYAERFSDPDGKLRATFDVVWLSGWAPHESQQKPLRPGSAKTRLADALGTTERSTGEKPDK